MAGNHKVLKQIDYNRDRMWPKIIWKYNMETDANGCDNELKLIVTHVGLFCDKISSGKIDITDAENKLKFHNRTAWKLEAYTKPKLCTYIQIHDFEETRVVIKVKLSRMKILRSVQRECN